MAYALIIVFSFYGAVSIEHVPVYDKSLCLAAKKQVEKRYPLAKALCVKVDKL